MKYPHYWVSRSLYEAGWWHVSVTRQEDDTHSVGGIGHLDIKRKDDGRWYIVSNSYRYPHDEELQVKNGFKLLTEAFDRAKKIIIARDVLRVENKLSDPANHPAP